MNFIQNLILYMPAFVPLDFLFIRASFQLINFIILILLLKLVVKGKWLQDGMKMLLVSFVSIVLTIYCIEGVHVYLGNIEIVQALLLIAITLIALLQLIRSQDIFIFLSPMFWIAGGTFFYYSMFLLTQSIPEYSVISGPPQQQKKVLLLIIILIQFIFYIIAAAVAGDKKLENSTMLD